MKRAQLAWVLVGWAVVLVAVAYANHLYWQIDVPKMKAWLETAGVIAPLVYVAVYTVRPLLLFPASLLSLAGGLAFGPVWGTIWTVLGASAGAAVSFASARWVRRSWQTTAQRPHEKQRSRTREQWEAVRSRIEQRGFWSVLVARLIPLFPFDLVSYVAGASRISFGAFIVATILGIVPGTFAYILFGHSLGMGDGRLLLLATGVLVVCIGVPAIVKRWMQRNQKERTIKSDRAQEAIVLYDGDCAVCHHGVFLILRHTPNKPIYVASLQSAVGKAVQEHYPEVRGVDSMIFWEQGVAVTKARALRAVGKRMGGIWFFFAVVSYGVPVRVLNALYDGVARNRNRWKRACPLPDASMRKKMLEEQDIPHWFSP